MRRGARHGAWARGYFARGVDVVAEHQHEVAAAHHAQILDRDRDIRLLGVGLPVSPITMKRARGGGGDTRIIGTDDTLGHPS